MAGIGRGCVLYRQRVPSNGFRIILCEEGFISLGLFDGWIDDGHGVTSTVAGISAVRCDTQVWDQARIRALTFQVNKMIVYSLYFPPPVFMWAGAVSWHRQCTAQERRRPSVQSSDQAVPASYRTHAPPLLESSSLSPISICARDGIDPPANGARARRCCRRSDQHQRADRVALGTGEGMDERVELGLVPEMLLAGKVS